MKYSLAKRKCCIERDASSSETDEVASFYETFSIELVPCSGEVKSLSRRKCFVERRNLIKDYDEVTPHYDAFSVQLEVMSLYKTFSINIVLCSDEV